MNTKGKFGVKIVKMTSSMPKKKGGGGQMEAERNVCAFIGRNVKNTGEMIFTP
jgi:hypothetical protein